MLSSCRAHIPYRDSKLTRILQSALGGNAKTAVICTINPDEVSFNPLRPYCYNNYLENANMSYVFRGQLY
jgi:hypothetical protein